jgi:hypothetical protein
MSISTFLFLSIAEPPTKSARPHNLRKPIMVDLCLLLPCASGNLDISQSSHQRPISMMDRICCSMFFTAQTVTSCDYWRNKDTNAANSLWMTYRIGIW